MHGPNRLVSAARSDIKDAIERLHIEPQGMITQMALAEARTQAPPEPKTIYRIDMTWRAARRSWWQRRPISSTRSTRMRVGWTG